MAKMCPMGGCRAKTGLCIHDKIMIAMGVMGALVAVAWFGVQLL